MQKEQNSPSVNKNRSPKKKSIIYTANPNTAQTGYHSYSTEQSDRAKDKYTKVISKSNKQRAQRSQHPKSSKNTSLNTMISRQEAEDIFDLLIYTKNWKLHGSKAKEHDIEDLMTFGRDELAINCLGDPPKGLYTLVKMSEVAKEGKRLRLTPKEEYSIQDSDYAYLSQTFDEEIEL